MKRFATDDRYFYPLMPKVYFVLITIIYSSQGFAWQQPDTLQKVERLPALSDTTSPQQKIIPGTTLDAVTVTAFENNQSRRNLAAAVSVLDSQSLEMFGNNSLVAAVNTVPGVKMDERSPGSYRLSIRGNLLRSTFGVRNTKVYWNGIPFSDASGNTYLNAIAPGLIHRMEIIKGPAGSMYGSGTGGVVLLQSGEAGRDSGTHFLQADIATGSYGLLGATVSGGSNGASPVGISFSHLQSDGYRDHSAMRRDAFQFTQTKRLNNNLKLGANIFLADLFYETPGGLTATELQVDPKQSRPAAGAFPAAATQHASIQLKTVYAGISLDAKLSNNWENFTGIYGSYTDFQNPTIRNYEDKYERGAGLRSVFRYRHSSWALAAGGELQQGYFYSGVSGNRLGAKDTLQFIDVLHANQLNLFAQVTYYLPWDLRATAGLSFNDFGYRYQRKNPLAASLRSDFSPRYVPRFSLLKKFGPASVYALYGAGYSVPSINEVNAGNDMFNATLQPELADNLEAGVKADLLDKKMLLELSVYQLLLKQTIVSRRDASGGDFYTNAGKTRQKGLEINAQYALLQNEDGFISDASINAGYSFIDALFVNYQQGNNIFDGKKLTGTPAHTGNLQLALRTAGGFYFNANYNYTSAIPLNDANSVLAEPYSLVFAKLGYQWPFNKSVLNIYGSIQRSLDTPYSLGNDLNAAGGRYFNPSAPQLFTIGVQYRLLWQGTKK